MSVRKTVARSPRTITFGICVGLISLVLSIETTSTPDPFQFQSFENVTNIFVHMSTAVSARAAITDSLLEKLLQDEQVQGQLSQKQVLHNKLGTIWLPLMGEEAVLKPRFATEETVFHLKSLAEAFLVGFESKNIIGAEWWYQNRGPTETIGFHYDKDEGVASHQMRMVFPELSTVTYLTSVGGPTFVMNMTTKDGNTNNPIVPTDGYLSYPRTRKHTVFDGSYMHGVVGDLALTTQPSSSGRRITLLINWWSRKPQPPNCRTLTPHEVDTFAPASSLVPTVSARIWTPEITKSVSLKTSAQLIPVKVVLPPLERLYLMFPESVKTTSSSHIVFEDAHTLGGVNDLDLDNEGLVNYIFALTQPKLFLFHRNDQLLEAEALLLPVIKPFLGRLKPYFANWESTQDAWEVFAIDERDAMSVAIHDTVNEKFFVMEKTPVTQETVVQFMQDYFDGNLKVKRSEL